jgi:hypothetical protein
MILKVEDNPTFFVGRKDALVASCFFIAFRQTATPRSVKGSL